MYKGLYVKYPLFFKKYSNIKFYENPSTGSGVIPCGQIGMTKITVAFSKFANEPKNKLQSFMYLCQTWFNAQNKIHKQGSINRPEETYVSINTSKPV
jgi:hypothetical protein